jgi:hypothetical protein
MQHCRIYVTLTLKNQSMMGMNIPVPGRNVVVEYLLTLVKYWCLHIEDFCDIIHITRKAWDSNKQHMLFYYMTLSIEFCSKGSSSEVFSKKITNKSLLMTPNKLIE